MANEENTENEEGKGEEGAQDAAGGKSKKKLFMIIGGVVGLLLLIGTPVAILTLSGGEKKEETEQADKDAAAVPEQVVYEGYQEEQELEESEETLGAIYPMETFVVNLKGGGYLRCMAQVEFNDRVVPRRFHTKFVPIRDQLITLLSSKSRDGLNDEKGKGLLKVEMKDIINQTMKREAAKYVYFTEFVIQ